MLQAPPPSNHSHFVNNEMDQKDRKNKEGNKRYEFPVHSDRSRAVAAAARASMEQTPPEGHRSSRSVFPAANAYAVQPIGYPSPLTAPPANTRMDVDAYASTEGERRWGEREWHHPPSPPYQRFGEPLRSQRPPSLERMREDVARSRPPTHLEDEITRLREENERLHHRLRIADFDRKQCDQKLAFLEEQLETRVSKRTRRDDSRSSTYHPYPRPERSGYSRDSSPGPDRPKRTHKASAGHKPAAGPSSSLAVPPAIHPRIEQSLDTTMEDGSVQPSPSTIPPAANLAARLVATHGTVTAPEVSYEKNPYEWDAAQGDDYDDSDSDTFARKEDLRQIRAAHRAAREKKAQAPPEVSYDTSEGLHGPWSGISIDSVRDWDEIYAAAVGGDDFALGYIAFLNTKYQRPGIARSQGITRLIKGFAALTKLRPESMKAYKTKVAALKKQVGTVAPRPMPNPPADQSSSLRNPLPEGVDSSDYYVSQSPPGNSLALPGSLQRVFASDTSNPRDPPQSVGRDWAATPVAHWPLGLRVSGANGLPRDPTDAEIAGEPATPHLPDVETMRWISELSPFRRRADSSTRAARRAWYNTCIRLFSVKGLYSALIERLGFPLGNRRRERFPFDTRNVDIYQVAVWFHDHGLYKRQPELQDIERWARLVRGLDGDTVDPEGTWNTFPQSVSTVLEGNPVLINASRDFQYPPRVPSAHARSWATAAERFVDEQRAANGLARLHNNVAPADESDDEAMEAPSGESTGAGPSKST